MASTKKSATTAKKPATKGSAAKAPAAKAKAAPAKATKPAAKKAAPITEKYTKTQIVNSLVESTELSRKQVNANPAWHLTHLMCCRRAQDLRTGGAAVEEYNHFKTKG